MTGSEGRPFSAGDLPGRVEGEDTDPGGQFVQASSLEGPPLPVSVQT